MAKCGELRNDTSPSLSSSISPELQVLNNDLILDHIVSLSTGLANLRLVHPFWNNAVLSSRTGHQHPRLTLCLPLKCPSGDSAEEDDFPLDVVKAIDPRLTWKVEVQEGFGLTMGDSFQVVTPTSFQLDTFCILFGHGIQILTFQKLEVTFLNSTLTKVMRTCGSLRELEMNVTPHRSSLHPRFPIVTKRFSPMTKLRTFKFVDALVFFEVDSNGEAAGLRLVQAVLNMAPHLTTLVLTTAFLPNLAGLKLLKSLSWVNSFSVEGFFDHATDVHSTSNNPALCYLSLGEVLSEVSGCLEEMMLGCLGLDGDCQGCRDMIPGKHMPPFILPRLKTLRVQGPILFMLEGGLGCKHFSQENLAKCETLEFQGERRNWGDFQSRMVEFLQSPGSTVVGVTTLRLLDIPLDTFKSLSFPPFVFPHLKSLTCTLQTCDDETYPADNVLTSPFKALAVVPTLQELNITFRVKTLVRHVISALCDSNIFQEAKALRCCILEFGNMSGGGSWLVDDTFEHQHHDLAVKLGACLLGTKNMKRVAFLSFLIPPTVLIPALRILDRLNLPVSFGQRRL